MSLRDLMWSVFRQTGQLEAYLLYRSCQEPSAVAEAAATRSNLFLENEE